MIVHGPVQAGIDAQVVAPHKIAKMGPQDQFYRVRPVKLWQVVAKEPADPRE